MPKQLQDKVVVVTGAGRGIGKAVALGFAREGASICCAARTRDEIDAVREAIEKEGGRAISVGVDVSDLASVTRLYEKTAEAFGGIDIAFLNAGVSDQRKTVEESDPAEWEKTIRINFFGAYYCAREVIPYLKKRGAGKIVFTGSGIRKKGYANRSAYGCSKAALWTLTRVLAEELHPFNISVNELIPGPVVTHTGREAMQARFPESEWIKEPEDVVPLALFMATQPDRGPTAQSFSIMRRDG